ncbi:thioesterase II family protein [Streptomyces colonosanans]|uniref:Thioesterase TesA-like domain-containing protein n=1 Tax=Streptomyces colonosanans TaxID=1428652 RepID=A0A1S2P6N2_9ACTN|nr:alpha/beta fold hydrolase [Streptomyces colonosanans]OIJ89380.1 hypothetical protein BIV24_20370 [Streptomyces colonosanans]
MSPSPSGRHTSWIRRHPRSPNPRARIICFPPAGSSASFYRSWPGHVPAGLDVVTVQYPGRQDRLNEPCLDRIESMAEHIAAELLTLSDLPLGLFGHSMGASVAYEVAVRLENAPGVRLAFLGVSARKAPQELKPRGIDCQNDDELISLLEELGGPDADAMKNRQLRELIMPGIRADFTACESYHPAHPPVVNVPITFYRGSVDRATDADDIKYWADLTKGNSVERVLPGGHFYLLEHEQLIMLDVARRIYTNL